MALLRPDPTFYASPRLAMQAPAEKLAYVAALKTPRQLPKRCNPGD
jgi:methanethiol oxidase